MNNHASALYYISMTDIAGSEVKFDRQGDGLARYDILNYQKNANASGYYYRVNIFAQKPMLCMAIPFDKQSIKNNGNIQYNDCVYSINSIRWLENGSIHQMVSN